MIIWKNVILSKSECSGTRAKGVAEQLFAKEIRSMTPGTNQLFQQKPRIEMLLSGKHLWRVLVSNGVDPFGRPTSTEH